MKAIAITPGKGEARLIDRPEVNISSPDEVKLKVLQVGICGTDREETSGGRADAPLGSNELVIGHEMFGRVVETGNNVKKVKKGDFALFMVRRPCSHCKPCHNRRSDLCSTGDYTERGIKGLDGFQAEYVVDKEEYLICAPNEISDIGVLTEPTSVVEKAINESLLIQSSRLPGTDISKWLVGKKALIAGIGPIGLLAAFVLKLKGAELFGLDIVDENSARPSILKEIGGTYINGQNTNAENIDTHYGKMDFILEATGIAKLELQLMDALALNGIYVLTGIPSGDRPVCILGSTLMRQMVLMNHIMLGSVNASYDHYNDAVNDLVKIKQRWPQTINKIITHRVPYKDFASVLSGHSPEEIKAVVVWSS